MTDEQVAREILDLTESLNALLTVASSRELIVTLKRIEHIDMSTTVMRSHVLLKVTCYRELT